MYHSLMYICFTCCSYSDKTLANILTPGEKLCGKKFELRVDDVLFVGHPTLVRKETQNQVEHQDSSLSSILFQSCLDSL